MSRHNEIERILAEADAEGYARGYADAIAAITAAAGAVAAVATKPNTAVPTQPPESPAPVEPTDQPANGNGRPRGRPAKAIALVREAIYAHPGLKGVELTRVLEKQGTPVIERTVRSCLRRLRTQKDVWQRKTRWYPKDKAESENLSGEASQPMLPH